MLSLSIVLATISAKVLPNYTTCKLKEFSSPTNLKLEDWNIAHNQIGSYRSQFTNDQNARRVEDSDAGAAGNRVPIEDDPRRLPKMC